MADPDPTRSTAPPPPEEPTDHSLLERFRGGNEEAATQLYLRYAQRLRALTRAQCSPDLVRRVEVDDIVQSVFASFFRRARQGYYDVPAGEELWGLFLVIALRKIRTKGKFHRRARRDLRRTVGGEWLEDAAEAVASGDAAARAFLELTVEDVLERLPEQHREAIRLRAEGHAVADIAGKLGRSKRSAERLLQEARQRLAELLLHEGSSPP
jgi:RNA polymerase sigma-70 factor (ECF subfamily)